jgi:hypothetical protein
MFFDVFNGDADGICSLHQLRLHEPRAAELITGVKRDIHLLRKIRDTADSDITVLDISLESNRPEIERLLNRRCRIFYVDHHFAGAVPDSPAFTSHIDPDPDICTSLIVDRLLNGRYRAWAVAGAFGDNLHQAATRTAVSLNLTGDQLRMLQEIGELFNYNGYGLTLADLHFPPQVLYKSLIPYTDPFAFFQQSEILARLRAGYAEDMRRARASPPLMENRAGRIYKLPAASWARRTAGVFSNEKARERPDLAHALLIDNGDMTFRVSVRAPLAKKSGADTLCLAFPTGGGRAAAAGINALPAAMLPDFLQSFEQSFLP